MMSPTILRRRYAPQKACSRLISCFRVTSYCRRVDLVCVFARRPRRTRRSHDCQRASRKLIVHAVALRASCTPLYCPGAMRPRKACSFLTSRIRVAFYCRRVDLVCAYARRPRRTLRSHDYQRESRKRACSRFLRIIHPTILSRRFAPAKGVQSCYLTLSGCVILSQAGPGVRLAWHRRLRQELRRQRCTARRIGGCDNHCDDNDAQHDCASHGWRGRDVRYARTIINAQHVC
jgi:hypothetical protein